MVRQALKPLSQEEIREIVSILYAAYGSEHGVLFGIPSDCRSGVERVVKATLRHIGLW